ncbi:MAG: MgtC/SapB family protein [Planctomycetota bacterium]
MTLETVLLRFGLALVGSLVFGIFRQTRGKPIGFGTFTFLALGSCALALTALSLQVENPLPLLSAIVTGIGFLGAGAILKTGDRVVGFTSAATIWVFAVLGLTLGVGEYLFAGLLYSAIWIVVAIDRWLENLWIGAHQRKLTVETDLRLDEGELESLGLPPRRVSQSFQVDRTEGTVVLSYLVSRRNSDVDVLVERLRTDPRIRRVGIEVA